MKARFGIFFRLLRISHTPEIRRLISTSNFKLFQGRARQSFTVDVASGSDGFEADVSWNFFGDKFSE